MHTRGLDLKPLTPAFGVQCNGIDLTQVQTKFTYESIMQAWNDHGGSVNLVANLGENFDEQSTKLSRLSVSARDNQSRSLVAPQVYIEPTRHRRPDGGPQCHRI